MTERYINPHTDFGFKRLFGSEFNKDLLISFLNALFVGEQTVKEVTFLNSEQLGERRDSRRAIFDVYCQNEQGDRFIVEMQNVLPGVLQRQDRLLLHLSPYENKANGEKNGTIIWTAYTPWGSSTSFSTRTRTTRTAFTTKSNSWMS